MRIYANKLSAHSLCMQHYDFKDKTVLITGASMGIGAEFARELSRRGAQLILVARSESLLQKLAHELGGATVIAQDLTQPRAARELFDAVTARDLAVDVLINNAGFGTHGLFTEIPLETQRSAIELNVGALVELTHTFLPMIERRAGGIIQVASTAAFQAVPSMAVYAASKAFVLSFSEALWGEYRDRGVRVLALCPGATDTPFFERAGEAAALGKKARPEAVVQLALRAFDRNKSHAIHGTKNFILAHANRLVPREQVIKLSARLMMEQC